MSFTIPEIFQFEYWLEAGFANILKDITPNVYDTATRQQTRKTPCIELKSVVGAYVEHRHKFDGGYMIGNPPQFVNYTAFDAYQSVLEVVVITNRGEDTDEMNHRRMLGLVRHRMSVASVWQNWGGVVILPQDVRPTGTTDTFIDDQDCDITVMSHDVLFCINEKDTWPDSIS
jgi:hypothetical protein